MQAVLWSLNIIYLVVPPTWGGGGYFISKTHVFNF